MAEKDEVRAAIIIVSGDWARYLETIKAENHKAVLERLIERYKTICEKLKTVHGISFTVNT